MKEARPLRKIILSTSFFPLGRHSKVPAFVKEQVEALIDAYPDLQVTVLTAHSTVSSAKGEIPIEELAGYRVVRFHYFWPHRLQCFGDDGILPSIKRNPFFLFILPFLFGAQFFALLRLCRQQRPDLIYSHWFTPQGVTGQLVSWMTGIPHVFTSHSTDIQVWNKVPLLGSALVRYLIPKAHGISVVSDQTRMKLKAFFGKKQWLALKKKVRIIPMGLNCSRFQPIDTITKEILKKQLGVADKTVLLFVGRLVEKKGVSYLLAAFAQLLKSHSNLCLVIAGDGPLQAQLQELALQLGIAGDVHFPGFISGKDKQYYFGASDVLILPSIVTSGGDCEGLPVVLMEGLAAGLVCLATRESGAEMCIKDGENGFLMTRAEDEQEISRKVCEILELSEESLLFIRKNGRQAAKRFDWSGIVSEYYELFQQ